MFVKLFKEKDTVGYEDKVNQRKNIPGMYKQLIIFLLLVQNLANYEFSIRVNSCTTYKT